MPMPLTISCSSKSRLALPFWYRLTQVFPDKGSLNGCCCCCCCHGCDQHTNTTTQRPGYVQTSAAISKLISSTSASDVAQKHTWPLPCLSTNWLLGERTPQPRHWLSDATAHFNVTYNRWIPLLLQPNYVKTESIMNHTEEPAQGSYLRTRED